MKLVETSAGVGELELEGRVLRRVNYEIRRFQEMLASGMPVPGMHRIEGVIDYDASRDPGEWVGVPLTLRLEDGRALGVTLADREGRVLTEGHGPTRCLCC